MFFSFLVMHANFSKTKTGPIIWAVFALMIWPGFFAYSAIAAPSPVAKSPHTYQGEQVLLARVQLQAYQNELNENGVSQKMGLGEALGSSRLAHYNGFFSYFELALRELAFNTLGFGRFLFTNKETKLLSAWREQSAQLDRTIATLNIIYHLMADRGVSFQNALAILNSEPNFAPIRAWSDHLAQSAWATAVSHGEKLPKRPILPSDFGLNFKTNFINKNWRELLSGQINIANVYVFWRGAEIISVFGQTRLGVEIAKRLHLSRMIDGIKALPPAMQKPALWMLYETADGCTIRYFQTAYVGFHGFNWHTLRRFTN